MLSSVSAFLNFLRFEKRYSQHTVLSYETDLSQFSLFARDVYALDDIEPAQPVHIRSWMAQLKGEGQSSRTIVRKLSSLRSFYKYLLKTGRISTVPTAGLTAPKISKRLPVFVKENEMSELIQALEASTEDWKGWNARMLITLFYSTGMRLSELIQLKEKQVDLSRMLIKVLGKGNKERVIPIHPATRQLLLTYTAEKRKRWTMLPETLLVTETGKKLYPKYAYLLVKKYLGQASTLEKKSPHVLRHSFATHLLNHGADLNAVKELLGHASLAATQVYTHNTIEKLKEAHKKAHPKG